MLFFMEEEGIQREIPIAAGVIQKEAAHQCSTQYAGVKISQQEDGEEDGDDAQWWQWLVGSDSGNGGEGAEDARGESDGAAMERSKDRVLVSATCKSMKAPAKKASQIY